MAFMHNYKRSTVACFLTTATVSTPCRGLPTSEPLKGLLRLPHWLPGTCVAHPVSLFRSLLKATSSARPLPPLPPSQNRRPVPPRPIGLLHFIHSHNAHCLLTFTRVLTCWLCPFSESPVRAGSAHDACPSSQPLRVNRRCRGPKAQRTVACWGTGKKASEARR